MASARRKDNREILITFLAVRSHIVSQSYHRSEPKPSCDIPAAENLPLRSLRKWQSADSVRQYLGKAEKWLSPLSAFLRLVCFHTRFACHYASRQQIELVAHRAEILSSLVTEIFITVHWCCNK